MRAVMAAAVPPHETQSAMWKRVAVTTAKLRDATKELALTPHLSCLSLCLWLKRPLAKNHVPRLQVGNHRRS
jgi:hypothetical protein